MMRNFCAASARLYSNYPLVLADRKFKVFEPRHRLLYPSCAQDLWSVCVVELNTREKSHRCRVFKVLYFHAPYVTHIDSQPNFAKVWQSCRCFGPTRLIVTEDEVKFRSLVVSSDTDYAFSKFVSAFSGHEVLSYFLMRQAIGWKTSKYLVIESGVFLLY